MCFLKQSRPTWVGIFTVTISNLSCLGAAYKQLADSAIRELLIPLATVKSSIISNFHYIVENS